MDRLISSQACPQPLFNWSWGDFFDLVRAVICHASCSVFLEYWQMRENAAPWKIPWLVLACRLLDQTFSKCSQIRRRQKAETKRINQKHHKKILRSNILKSLQESHHEVTFGLSHRLLPGLSVSSCCCNIYTYCIEHSLARWRQRTIPFAGRIDS